MSQFDALQTLPLVQKSEMGKRESGQKVEGF
jgi:hypothetical protein